MFVARFGDTDLIPGGEKWGQGSKTSCFNLDQTIPSIEFKRRNIEAKMITLILGDMFNPVGQFFLAGTPQSLLLEFNHQFLSGFTKRTIPRFNFEKIPSDRLAYDIRSVVKNSVFGLLPRRCDKNRKHILKVRNLNRFPLHRRYSSLMEMKCARQAFLDQVSQDALIIRERFIAVYIRITQFN